jgi:hypothetical protein
MAQASEALMTDKRGDVRGALIDLFTQIAWRIDRFFRRLGDGR